MRHNGPVTHHEFQIGEGQTLVSTTDLKSRIQYCNPSFIEVSGYEREELIGQPHNMIRHPDMPAEAFRDMWTTIQGGNPWSGLVKNRRKNGDHYWVMANVTPVLEAGRIAGFMSVRTKPTREQVQQAEALYARMREEASSGHQVHVLASGHLQRRTPGHRLQRAAQTLLAQRTVLWLLAIGTGGALLGAYLPSHALAFGITTGIALAAGWWQQRQSSRPLDQIVQSANRMAAGDLGQRGQRAGTGLIGQISPTAHRAG